MVAARVKVLTVEENGTDLTDATERLLTVDDMAFAEDGDSMAITESGGAVTAVEYYRSATQTEANRKIRVDITYASGLPTVEAWKYYDANGTTVLRTITLTHTWSGSSLLSTTETVT